MKRSIRYFLISFSLLIFSCSSRSDMVIGEWKVVKYEIPRIHELIEKQLTMAPDSIRDQYKEMLYRNADKMQTEVLKSTFEFREDGVFNIITTDFTQNGTWSMNKEGTMIYSKDSSAEFTDTFYITTLNDKKLEFKISNVDRVESIFGLEKINDGDQ